MISDVFFTMLFLTLFVVFGANALAAVKGRSVWAKNTEIRRSEHPIAFGLATLTSASFSVTCLLMAWVCAAHLLGRPL